MTSLSGMPVLVIVSILSLSAGCSSTPAMLAAGSAGSQQACTIRLAQPVRLGDVERNADRYIGRCIVVSAVFDGDELFTTVHAAGSNPDSVAVVGAFIDYERWKDDELSQGRFSGVVTDCRASEMNAVAQAEASGRVFLDVWVLGCQRGQRVHLVGLETADLVAVR